MIPRNIPKRKFIGESVAESSFIASRGIDETKAPTQRDSLMNIKNLEVNYDGSLSPRKPVTLNMQLPIEYIYLGTAFSGDYVCLKQTQTPDTQIYTAPYRICIVNKTTGTEDHIINTLINNSDVKLINTNSSIIIENCDIGEHNLATFKISKITDWVSEQMVLDITELEFIDGNPQINPNLMLTDPFNLRDNYDSASIFPIGILAYLKGTFDANYKFTPALTDNPEYVKDILENPDYKIIETLPNLNAEFNFNKLYLKCFINSSSVVARNTYYYIRWEKTTNGIYWEAADSSYESNGSRPSGTDRLIKVNSNLINTSIAEADATEIPCLFKLFNPVQMENDTIDSRPDILIIPGSSEIPKVNGPSNQYYPYDPNALNYSYRCLVYMCIDEAAQESISLSNAVVQEVDGKSTTTTYQNKAYYVPTYNASRTTRTFKAKLQFNASVSQSNLVLGDVNGDRKFSVRVYSKHSYCNTDIFMEVNQPYTSPNLWSLEAGSVDTEAILSGTISLNAKNELTNYPMNYQQSQCCALHYTTYIAVYYNNLYIGQFSYKEIIPLKDMPNGTLLDSSNLQLNMGTLSYYNESSSYLDLCTSRDVKNWIELTSSSYLRKLYKMPSSIKVSCSIPLSLFHDTSKNFYTIDHFTFYGAYTKLELVYRNRGSTGSWSVSSTVEKSSGSSVIISSSNNSSTYSKLMGMFDGSGISSSKEYALRIKQASNGATVIPRSWTTAQQFREYYLTTPVYNDYFKSMFTFTKTVRCYFSNNDSGVFPDAYATIYSINSNAVPTNYDYIYPQGVYRNISNTNLFVWFTSTGQPDSLFRWTDYGNMTFYMGTATPKNYPYNYFGNDDSNGASYGNVAQKYEDSYQGNYLYDGFPLNGDGTRKDLLRNTSNNCNALYLDLGENNANKGYKLYWNHRIVSYGAFKNNILFSDSDSLITPMLNTLTLNASQDTQITTVVPWRNYLIAATKEAIYLVSELSGGFGHKTVNTFIGIPESDRRTCKAILNGIIFKSNNKVYTLQPGIYSNDDSVLNIAEISQPIETLLSKVDNTGNYNFAISTSKYYYLFTPGYPTGKTTCFKYDYIRRIWTTLEFPVVIKDYIQTTEDELYVVTLSNAILSFEKDFTEYVKSNNDINNDDIPDADIPYGDYLSKDEYTPIPFVLDSGQKTDNISTTKQFVETKLIIATMDNMDNFPIDVDIYIDGMHFKNVHTDLNTDGAVLKQELQDSLILGTDVTSKDIDLQNVFRQLILRYSGKGKSIRHVISGNSTYNFRLYVTYYRYKLTHNKQ